MKTKTRRIMPKVRGGRIPTHLGTDKELHTLLTRDAMRYGVSRNWIENVILKKHYGILRKEEMY